MRACLTTAFGILAVSAQIVHAQTITRPLDILSMPAWPRAAGLANIGAATNLPEGLFYNPALAGAVAAVAGSAHFFGDSALTTVVTGITTGVANVGVGVQLLRANLGPNPLVDPVPGGSLPDEFGLTAVGTVGAAMRFKGVRFGASAKYIQLVERSQRESGVAFDVGAQRQIGPFSVGLAVQNLGDDLHIAPQDDLELPMRATLAAEGQGLPIGAFVDFGAAAALAVDRDGEILPAIAGQILYTPLDGWTFTARAGVRRPAPLSNQRPVTGGLAITLDRLTIDYGVEAVKNADAVHRIGIRLR